LTLKVHSLLPNQDTSNGVFNKSLMEDYGSEKPFWRHLGPVLFLVLIFLLNFSGRIILAPLLPSIEKELEISHSQAGSFFFLIATGYLVGLVASGFWAPHTTHRFIIVISGAGVGLGLLGVSCAGGLSTIFLGLVVVGFAAGLYIPSAIATITALIEQPHWGKAIAVHELAPNLAFFMGPFLAELFLQGSTWRMALAAVGSAAVIASLAYYRWGRGGNFAGQSPASSAFRQLTRAPAFWLMLMLFGLGVSSTIGVYAMLPLYLVSERQMNQSWANTIVALSRSYGPILGLLGGLVSDRLGPKQTILASLVFTGVVTALLGLIPYPWISAVVLFQPLLAVWFFPAAFAALAAITRPEARNLAVGFAVPFGYMVGGGGIPTFIGVMGDAGSFALGFVAVGILIASGGALALLLKLPETGRPPA
jgi:NNP family nitrate/nitrite transporter-like MFS transporter